MKTMLVLAFVSLWAVATAQEVIPWTYFVVDGGSVEMYCNDTEAKYQPEPDYVLKWLRDEKEIVADSDKYEFVEHMGLDKLYLKVKNVMSADYGAYYCAVYNSTMDFAFNIRKGINVEGKMYESTGEMFRVPVIIGCVAAAVVLFCILLIAFVYKFRYRKESNSKYTVNNDFYGVDKSKVNSQAFDNPAMDSEDYDKSDLELSGPVANGTEEITTNM